MGFAHTFFNVVGKIFSGIALFIFGVLFIVQGVLVGVRSSFLNESVVINTIGSEEFYSEVEQAAYNGISNSLPDAADELDGFDEDRYRELVGNVLTYEVYKENVDVVVPSVFAYLRGDTPDLIIPLELDGARMNFRETFVEYFADLPLCSASDIEDAEFSGGPPTCKAEDYTAAEALADPQIQEELDEIALQIFPDEIDIASSLPEEVSVDRFRDGAPGIYRTINILVISGFFALALLLAIASVLATTKFATMLKVAGTSLFLVALSEALGVGVSWYLLGGGLLDALLPDDLPFDVFGVSLFLITPFLFSVLIYAIIALVIGMILVALSWYLNHRNKLLELQGKEKSPRVS